MCAVIIQGSATYLALKLITKMNDIYTENIRYALIHKSGRVIKSLACVFSFTNINILTPQTSITNQLNFNIIV